MTTMLRSIQKHNEPGSFYFSQMARLKFNFETILMIEKELAYHYCIPKDL